MSRRAVLLAAVAVAAACNKSSTSPSLRLKEPTGVALFYGYTDRRPSEPSPYVAIANSGSDELVLVDAVDDAAVASSIAIRPLSVPVPDARPALVAAARLGDDDASKLDAGNKVIRRPDLLVVVSQSSTSLQLVKTWLDASGLPQSVVDDGANGHVVDLGRPVRALAAVPAVGADGKPIAGEAWVVAALVPASGQGADLAVVTYRRTTDPATKEPDAILPDATVVTQHLHFEVRSFGVDPSAGVTRFTASGDVAYTPLSPQFLYAASGDPIPDASGVYGVAELDMSPGPGAFTVRGLDARAPTTLVAGLTLAERNVDQSGSYDQVIGLPLDSGTHCGAPDGSAPDDLTQDTADTSNGTQPCPRLGFHTPGADVAPHRRVYATLDPAFCGADMAIACGVAVLDPESAPSATHGHLLSNPFLGASGDRVDPGGQWSRRHDDAAEPYLPPIALGGNVLALVPVPQNAWEGYTDRTYQRAPFMVLTAFSSARLSSGALAVLSSSGRVFVLDAGRWEYLNDTYPLRTSSALGLQTYYPGATSIPQIGFYLHDDTTGQATSGRFVLEKDSTTASNALRRDPAGGATFVSALTLGYTTDDTWSVAYQGFLPGLEVARPIEIEQGPAADQLRVTFQARTPAGKPTQVQRVYDPSNGIRLGDVVQIWTQGEGGQCPATQDSTDTVPIEPIEGQVVELSPPDAGHPGGSLVLAAPVPWVNVDGGYTRVITTAQDYWNGTNGSTNCRQELATLAGTGFYASSARVRARGADPADPDPVGTLHHEFLVKAGTLGYVGRAVQNSDDDANGANGGAPHDYVLRTRDESSLTCPLVPWPFAENGQASIDATCDAACRDRCEQLVVARKARRFWTVSVRCVVDDSNCATYYPDFDVSDHTVTPPTVIPTKVVQPTGPVIAFRLGVDFSLKVDPSGDPKKLVRDTVARFVTQSGFRQSARYSSQYSSGSGVQPSAGVGFDRSRNTDWGKRQDGPRAFVPYLDGMLLDIPIARTNSDTRQLR